MAAEKPQMEEKKINLEDFFAPKPLFGDDKDFGVIIQTKSSGSNDNKDDSKNDESKQNVQKKAKHQKNKAKKNGNESDSDDCEPETCVIDDNGYMTEQDYSLSTKDFKAWAINKIILKSNFNTLLGNTSKKLDETSPFWKFLKRKYPAAYNDIKAKAQAQVSYMTQNEGKLIQMISFDEIAAIHLYTTNVLYSQLNASLRSRKDEWAIFCGPLLSGISKLPFEWKPLYRGVSYHEVVNRIRTYYKKDVVLRWDSFSSTSTNYNTAQQFAGSKGAVFEVENGFRGRDIAKFSQYPSESEVLFNLSSHFLITKKYAKENDKRIYIKCKELPFPWDSKTILWVDDQPSNNKNLIEKFERNGVMVIPRISTHGAIEFLDFMSDAINLNTYSKFRVITDMYRIEYENDDTSNEEKKGKDKEAGVTLIEELRKRGYQNIVCIFTSNKDRAIKICRDRGVYDDKVIVTVTEKDVENYASFKF